MSAGFWLRMEKKMFRNGGRAMENEGQGAAGPGQQLTVGGVLNVVIEFAVASDLSKEEGNGGHTDPGQGAQCIDDFPLHLVLWGGREGARLRDSISGSRVKSTVLVVPLRPWAGREGRHLACCLVFGAGVQMYAWGQGVQRGCFEESCAVGVESGCQGSLECKWCWWGKRMGLGCLVVCECRGEGVMQGQRLMSLCEQCAESSGEEG